MKQSSAKELTNTILGGTDTIDRILANVTRALFYTVLAVMFGVLIYLNPKAILMAIGFAILFVALQSWGKRR